MEIQLRILQHCLLAETHIVDFGSGPEALSWEPYARPQKDLAMNIIFTCRIYHEEGWKIFFQQNKFKYTSLSSMYFWVDGLRLTPKSMLTMHHLALCLREKDHATLVDGLNSIFEACDVFESLETLHIHIERVHYAIGYLPTFSGLEAGGLTGLVAEACKMYTWHTEGVALEEEWVGTSSPLLTKLLEKPSHSVARHGPRGSLGRVKEILITGLPGDEWKLEPLVVRLLSTMLCPQGRFGIGKGLDGIQYYQFISEFSPPQWAKMMRRPRIEWVEARDVDRWIRTNGHLGNPLVMHDWMNRLFSLVDRKHPFFKGWI